MSGREVDVNERKGADWVLVKSRRYVVHACEARNVSKKMETDRRGSERYESDTLNIVRATERISACAKVRGICTRHQNWVEDTVVCNLEVQRLYIVTCTYMRV